MERMIGSPRMAKGALVVLAAVAVSSPALAQDSSADAWLPWLGCWELANGRDDTVEVETIGTRLVCVVPAAGIMAAEITTIVDDQVVHSRTLRADGSERTVSEDGCSGIGRTTLSSDGNRLLENGRLQCAGGTARTISGMSMLVRHDTWVDVQVIGAGQERELLVRRYRRDAEASRRALADHPAATMELAAETARRAAAAPLSLDAVLEASDLLDPAVLEAALIESDSAFEIDGNTLIALADAGVDPAVIDVMVALSFPDYFAFDEAESYGGGGYVGTTFPIYMYGYYSPAFAPFGWSYYGAPYYGGRPVVIGVGPNTGRYGGRVVNGSGYARVRVRDDAPRGGFGSFLGGKRSSGRNSGGTVSRGGHQSGGSSSSAGAKPRGGSSSGAKAKPRGQQ